jgi:hypothetical protein
METGLKGRPGRSRAVKWRIAFTIITTTVWLVALLYWIGFLWPRYEVGQSIASLCIATTIYGGLNALAWALWPGRSEPSKEE